MKRGVGKCCLGWAISLCAAPLYAQQIPSAGPAPASQASPATPETPKAVNEKLAQLDQRVTAAQSSADNAWMLVSAALVLMMTGPGLALFYGGLVRRKNELGTMMHSFGLMAVVTVVWAIVGYSLAFGEGLPVIGDLRYLFLE